MKRALALDPNSATAHNGLGLLAIDNDRPGVAVKAFERAAAIECLASTSGSLRSTLCPPARRRRASRCGSTRPLELPDHETCDCVPDIDSPADLIEPRRAIDIDVRTLRQRRRVPNEQRDN